MFHVRCWRVYVLARTLHLACKVDERAGAIREPVRSKAQANSPEEHPQRPFKVCRRGPQRTATRKNTPTRRRTQALASGAGESKDKQSRGGQEGQSSIPSLPRFNMEAARAQHPRMPSTAQRKTPVNGVDSWRASRAGGCLPGTAPTETTWVNWIWIIK